MEIYPRSKWSKDRAPRDLTSQSPRNVREMFLHYPAASQRLNGIDRDQEQVQYMRAIRDFHMDTRGWDYFAYTHAVFQDGEVYQGRGIGHIPAAQEGHNTNTFAVLCVLGNTESPSFAMRSALVRLKNHYDHYAHRDLTAKPHSAATATSCPGDKLRAFIPELNRKA